jgi:pimeloyl-ACP methyl ester carboxylesterase
MSKRSRLLALGLLGLGLPGRAAEADSALGKDAVQYHSVRVGDVDIFYREAGPRGAPVLLLLHGFPTSSFMFRELIPALSDRYHVVAPDYPGFGQSSFPDRREFAYTFEHLAQVMDDFTQTLGLGRYAIYIQDYGAPIGLRLAMRHPERVTALIVQNGNAYEEGLSSEWAPLRAYWNEPTVEHRGAMRVWLGTEGARLSYLAGVPEAQHALYSPDTWTLDGAGLGRPGSDEVQLDLFHDYRTNVALYPRFHAFFRERRPPTLIVWGRFDPFFTVAGAEAYRRDLPDAELHVLDAGHFALETHGRQIAALIREFLERLHPRG